MMLKGMASDGRRGALAEVVLRSSAATNQMSRSLNTEGAVKIPYGVRRLASHGALHRIEACSCPDKVFSWRHDVTPYEDRP